MIIDIITIFPDMFAPVLNESIVKRAQQKGKVKILVHDLRDYTRDKHRKVDDRPFGGGSGMVMCADPIFRVVEELKRDTRYAIRDTRSAIRGPRSAIRGPRSAIRGPRSAVRRTKVILLTPQGQTLTQKSAKQLSKCKHLILICGHYEGIDERVREGLADEEVSIGDYVLTGGELPAMVLVDCVVRLLPGVLGDKNSLKFESFESNLLEYPQYTRPAEYRDMKVPAVLVSGDHTKIEEWRKEQSIRRTKERRPDLARSHKRSQNGG